MIAPKSRGSWLVISLTKEIPWISHDEQVSSYIPY